MSDPISPDKCHSEESPPLPAEVWVVCSRSVGDPQRMASEFVTDYRHMAQEHANDMAEMQELDDQRPFRVARYVLADMPSAIRAMPDEPTPHMVDAYLTAQRESVMASDREFAMSDPRANFRAGYKAMLAAAPVMPSSVREPLDGIYVASRVVRAPVWKAYRDRGFKLTASWIDEAGEGETADFAELWERIRAEIKRSRALVLYAAGVHDFPFKGALVEVGIALAMRKPVFVALDDVMLDGRTLRPLGSWALDADVTMCDSLDDAMERARVAVPATCFFCSAPTHDADCPQAAVPSATPRGEKP